MAKTREDVVEDAVIQAIGHYERRNIIKIIGAAPGGVTYTEILGETGLNTGHLNYHLRGLEGTVERDDARLYRLTPLGLKAYMLLRAYGRNKYSRLVQQNLDQIRYLASLIEREPYMEHTKPVISNVACFRYNPGGLGEEQLEKLNRMIAQELWKINFYMVSDTKIKGRYMLRACNVNHRSRREDFDFLVDQLKRIGARCAKEFK